MSGFAIFLTIVLSLYALINSYIFIRSWQALQVLSSVGKYYIGPALFFILAYPLGRFLEKIKRSFLSNILIFIGAIYLAFMVYFSFILVGIDFLNLVNRIFHFYSFSPEQTLTVLVALLFIVALIVTAGYVNTLFPRIRELEIRIHKHPPGVSRLNVVVVSDIHLGTLIRNGRLKKIVQKINQLQPDIVLIPGDIVDEDIAPVREARMADVLQEIRSRFGVFAVTGNHEYFSGVQAAIQYLKKGNIQVLNDSLVKVADSFYIVGRRDAISTRFGEKRLPLETLTKEVDSQLPVILMDHQPLHLEEAQKAGVDLQVSGHTHNGQIFPFNWIAKKVYELSWGYKKKGQTHYYVSCGVGTWGPPVRIGSTPEIVNIKVQFD